MPELIMALIGLLVLALFFLAVDWVIELSSLHKQQERWEGCQPPRQAGKVFPDETDIDLVLEIVNRRKPE